MNQKIVLFPGRFQPLHNGHAEILFSLASGFGRVILPIAQAQLSHMDRHPLTGAERYEMLRDFVIEEGLKNVELIPLPYDCYLTTWVAFIETICPPFNAVYARNPLMRALFRERGYALVEPLFERKFSGIMVRTAIASNGEWQRTVPKAVARFLTERNLVQRIREVSQDENI